MIVTCPACEGRFQVEREQLGYDGRIVRCGKCGNCWHQMPEDDPRAAVAEPEAPPLRRRFAAAAAPPPPKKKGRGVLIGWLLLLLFVGGLAAGAWFERESIVARFPQLADAYALVGIPVNPPGQALELTANLESQQVGDDTVIKVRGRIANISDHKQTLPTTLRAQLTDAGGAVLAEWTFDIARHELDAGAAVEFQTETRNPPAGAQNLAITFVRDGTQPAN